ncbi:unnamed protein product, partial [Nesidiocoris tenuis]
MRSMSPFHLRLGVREGTTDCFHRATPWTGRESGARFRILEARSTRKRSFPIRLS